MSRTARVLLAVLALVIVGNPLLLYAIQEKLLFHPVPVNEGQRRIIKERYGAVEEISIPAADGSVLRGWFQKSQADKAGLILYFGGNEEDVSYVPAQRDRVEGWSLAVIDYRGYGLSSGTPGEAAIFSDALTIYDTLAKRADVDPERIAVLGRSLGTGVATYVASQRPVRAAILVTPYDSIQSVAQDRFWFAPVGLILKHRFDSISRAPRIAKPALFIIAGADEIIPAASSRRLYDAWGGPKTWHVVGREGHNTVDFDPAYWKTMASFLASGS